jgi:protein-S-isoprenylcysteine O-methyltransferase Ste14
MFVLVRALVYGTLFVGLLLLVVPAQVLSWAGVARPAGFGPVQLAGVLAGVAGAVLAMACVLTFVVQGRGTPAPFDPPRRLVTGGPYRFVRNPMYSGALLVIAGAALAYGAVALLAYGALFALGAHAFVVGYEEPALRRSFGGAYADYCRRVRRWRPRI